MSVKFVFYTAVAVVLAALTVSTPSGAGEFDHAARTGIVHLDEKGTPLFEIPSLHPGTQPYLETGTLVSVVIIESGGVQRLVRAKVSGAPAPVSASESRLAVDGTAAGATRYKLEIAGSTNLPTGTTGVGMAGVTDLCKTSEGIVSCDLEAGGPAQSFRICASRGGLHLSVWSGEPMEGIQRWHAYYYLGYDIEPDCTNRDLPN